MKISRWWAVAATVPLLASTALMAQVGTPQKTRKDPTPTPVPAPSAVGAISAASITVQTAAGPVTRNFTAPSVCTVGATSAPCPGPIVPWLTALDGRKIARHSVILPSGNPIQGVTAVPGSTPYTVFTIAAVRPNGIDIRGARDMQSWTFAPGALCWANGVAQQACPGAIVAGMKTRSYDGTGTQAAFVLTTLDAVP